MGGKLPSPIDKKYPSFEKALRGWYKTSVDHEDEQKRKENRYYYLKAAEHLSQFGILFHEIEHTGRLIKKVNKEYEDDNGSMAVETTVSVV